MFHYFCKKTVFSGMVSSWLGSPPRKMKQNHSLFLSQLKQIRCEENVIYTRTYLEGHFYLILFIEKGNLNQVQKMYFFVSVKCF